MFSSLKWKIIVGPASQGRASDQLEREYGSARLGGPRQLSLFLGNGAGREGPGLRVMGSPPREEM